MQLESGSSKINTWTSFCIQNWVLIADVGSGNNEHRWKKLITEQQFYFTSVLKEMIDELLEVKSIWYILINTLGCS